MDPAAYQELKGFLLTHLPLTKDAFHVYIGFGCLLVSILVFRFKASQWRALLLGLLVSIAMEALDLQDNVRYLNQTQRALGGLKDILNTNALPFLTVLLVRRHERRAGRRGRRDSPGGEGAG